MISKLHWTKKATLFIIIIFVASIILGNVSDYFRGTYIYKYLSLTIFICSFGSFIWSFVNSILMYKEINIKSKPDIFWLIFSAIPFLYFFVSIIIVFLFK